jgi:argininosuccinate lyase
MDMMVMMVSSMEVSADILSQEKYRYLFSVEEVNRLVNEGMPFREAYREVAARIERGEFRFDHTKGLNHTHEGSIGNPCFGEVRDEMEKVLGKFACHPA